jgi:hypothetical protein
MTHPAAKILRNIQTERFHRVFDDWLEAMLLAHCADRKNPDCPHEAAYMKLVNHYGPREEGKPHAFDYFKEATRTVIDLMEQDNELSQIRDHLGEIYEQEGHNNPHMGQFFTPMSVCNLITTMTTEESTKRYEHVAINDPTCGSGRYFLASLPHYKPYQVTYYGTDKDRTCAKMSVMNMLWRNASSYIVWGDTLKLEAYGGWATMHTPFGGTVREMNKDQAQIIFESGLRQVAEETQRMVPTQVAQEVKEAAKARENKRGQYEMEL